MMKKERSAAGNVILALAVVLLLMFSASLRLRAEESGGSSMTISGTVVSEQGIPADTEFVLELKADAGRTPEAPLPEVTSVMVRHSGKFAFGPIGYKEVGDYYYEIREKAGESKDIVYDETVFGICVSVRYNEKDEVIAEGMLVSSDGWKEKRSEVEFSNQYMPPAALNGSASVTIKKNLVDKEGRKLRADKAEFWVALFDSEKMDHAVIQPQKLTFTDSSTASVEIKGLEAGTTYYVSETTEKGEVQNVWKDETFGYGCTAVYPNGQKVTAEAEAGKAVLEFNNEYDQIPQQYYLEGTIEITKKVRSADGRPLKVTDTFEVSIYRMKNGTKELYGTPVQLELKDASSSGAVSVPVAVGQTPGSQETYYVEETKDGKPVSEVSGFKYTAEHSKQQVTLSGTVLTDSIVITNTKKDSKDIENGNGTGGSSYGGGGDSYGVKTGDDTPIALYAGLLAAAVIVLAGIFVWRRRRS